MPAQRTHPDPQPSFRKLETKTLPPFLGFISCQVIVAENEVASAPNGHVPVESSPSATARLRACELGHEERFTDVVAGAPPFSDQSSPESHAKAAPSKRSCIVSEET